MPSTKSIGATLGTAFVPTTLLLAAFNLIHWDTGETAAVGALWAVTVASIMAIVEHLRPGTPSRWVAIFGLVGPEASAILGVLFVFHVITDVQVGAVMGVVAVIGGLLGVPIAQNEVFSRETRDSELQAATELVHPADIAK